MPTGWVFLMKMNKIYGGFFSRERPGTRASNSELKRWLKNKALHINGVAAVWDEEVPRDIRSVILFPKSKKARNTLV